MKQVSFTEFRQNAASFFDSVERGATIQILRHGKPIADIVPVETSQKTVSWKRPGLMLEANGSSLSKEILRERKSTRR